jgi:hypothetical protein
MWKQLLDGLKEAREIVGIDRGITRSFSVENPLWNG